MVIPFETQIAQNFPDWECWKHLSSTRVPVHTQSGALIQNCANRLAANTAADLDMIVGERGGKTNAAPNPTVASR
jgi:hypothetical protein